MAIFLSIGQTKFRTLFHFSIIALFKLKKTETNKFELKTNFVISKNYFYLVVETNLQDYMAKKDSKTNLLDHSKAKVRLLGEYLKRYLNIICNDRYTQKIYVYDLFCGEGLYQDGGEGSPLVILKEISDIHKKNIAGLNKIPPIDCHFNDFDSSKNQKVQKVISEKSLHERKFGALTFTSNDYKDELEKLARFLPYLKKEKAFVFVDPYEYKHIKASHIKSLLNGNNSEVLLWLPIQHMYRFIKKGTPKALYDFMDEINDSQDWAKSSSVWKFIEKISDGFQAFMGSNFFVDYFAIQKDPQTVFSLFFFTSHIKGFEKMLEAKWELDEERGIVWEYSGNSPSLFSNQKTNPLDEKLKAFIQERARNNGELYEFTLRARFLPKHAKQIFRDWQERGILEITETKSGKKARKSAFYIDYKNYKNEGEKVLYKLR